MRPGEVERWFGRIPGVGAKPVENHPDHLVEGATGKEAAESEGAHRDHQAGSEQFQHLVEPRRTERDLPSAGAAISGPVRGASRKARGHGGHVDAAANILIAGEAAALEPAHQLTAGATGEGARFIDLDPPWSLADEQDPLARSAAEHGVGGRQQAGIDAPSAGSVRSLQSIERTGGGLVHHNI